MARKPPFALELRGFPELVAKMDELGTSGAKKVVREATIRTVRNTLLPSIKTAIPDRGDQAVTTGQLKRLKRHIKPISGKRSRKFAVQRFVKMPEREKLGIDPKDRYYWPVIYEYGTRDGRVRGRGHFRRGYDQAEPTMIRQFPDLVMSRIGEFWKNKGKKKIKQREKE